MPALHFFLAWACSVAVSKLSTLEADALGRDASPAEVRMASKYNSCEEVKAAGACAHQLAQQHCKISCSAAKAVHFVSAAAAKLSATPTAHHEHHPQLQQPLLNEHTLQAAHEGSAPPPPRARRGRLFRHGRRRPAASSDKDAPAASDVSCVDSIDLKGCSKARETRMVSPL